MKRTIIELRWVMALVALAAVALGIVRWGILSARYRRLAEDHAAAGRLKQSEAENWAAAVRSRWAGPVAEVRGPGVSWSSGQDLANWALEERAARESAAAHARAAAQYRRAAARPWNTP